MSHRIPRLIPLKHWPLTATANDIFMFLHTHKTLSFNNATIGQDYNQPNVYGMVSAYTAAPEHSVEPFCPIFIGVVSSKVTTDKDISAQTFRISQPKDKRLAAIFATMLVKCSQMMEVDDLLDEKEKPSDQPSMRRICDTPAFSGRGGTFIQVDVSYYSDRAEFIHDHNTCSIHVSDGDIPLSIGDTVMFQATLHKSMSVVDGFRRTYRILARRIKTFQLLPDSPAGSSWGSLPHIPSTPVPSPPASAAAAAYFSGMHFSGMPSTPANVPDIPAWVDKVLEEQPSGPSTSGPSDQVPSLSNKGSSSFSYTYPLRSRITPPRSILPSPPITPKRMTRKIADVDYDGPAKRLRKRAKQESL